MGIHSFDDVMNLVSTYISNEHDIEFIKHAFNFASNAHNGQERKSGEPYINHCIEVGYILAKYQSSPDTIAAGFLHDIVEDTQYTVDDIKKEFDDDVANIVMAVTKIKRLPDVSLEETNAMTHRKLILAMAKDIRAVIVKLCDRLHNMRTLNYLNEAHQLKIAKETLEVYAPIAHRLGMSELKNELENLSLYYLDRESYDKVDALIDDANTKRTHNIDSMIELIKKELDKNNYSYRIFGRSKHLYSVYKKMYIKKVPFEQIFDLQAIRIIVHSKLECYEVLGIIHTIFRPLPGRFKDYIAMPKTNMYQSLHTTVLDENGDLFEIQIRSEEMDYIAERGIAAHWIYKENYESSASNNQKLSEKQLSWLRDLIKINDETSDSSDIEYMQQVQKDIFETSIYVLTPHGKIIDMPKGSTPVDFAFRVHSNVGMTCIGSIVNKVIVPLNTELHNGDIVEILTKNGASPSIDWLTFVKTNTARSQIKKYYAKKEADERVSNEEILIKKGYSLLEDACKERLLNVEDVIKYYDQGLLVKNFNVYSKNELLMLIANKAVTCSQVINNVASKNLDVAQQIDEINKRLNFNLSKKSNNESNILIRGAKGIKIETAICCLPIPGDSIVGFISRGSGIKVHRVDCKNIINEKSRLIEASWSDNIDDNITYPIKINVLSADRNNLVVDLMGLLSSLKIKIDSISARSHPENKTATISATIHVSNAKMFEYISTQIKQINGVISVIRR